MVRHGNLHCFLTFASLKINNYANSLCVLITRQTIVTIKAFIMVVGFLNTAETALIQKCECGWTLTQCQCYVHTHILVLFI